MVPTERLKRIFRPLIALAAIFLFLGIALYLLPEESANAPVENADYDKTLDDGASFNEESLKAMGFVRQVYEKNGEKFLDIDYAQMLSGEEAILKVMEDKNCPREKVYDCAPSMNNDFYIRNISSKIRTFKISDTAQIIRVTGAENPNFPEYPVNYEIFKGYFANNSSESWVRNLPFHIEVVNGKVVKITEQYIP